MHCTVNVSIPSPKCFPNNGAIIRGIRIESFTLDFESFDPHYSPSDINKDDVQYFYPYKYRLRIRGKAPSAGMIGFRLTFSGFNGYESIPANNMIVFETKKDGTFDIDTFVHLCQFGDRVFAT